MYDIAAYSHACMHVQFYMAEYKSHDTAGRQLTGCGIKFLCTYYASINTSVLYIAIWSAGRLNMVNKTCKLMHIISYQ